MTNPKAVFAEESINLIKKLTGFTEDEENFEICENFVLSNLLYHSFLDPVPSKVKAHYDGLIQKWEIHAKEGKASSLSQLLHKFLNDPLFSSSDVHMVQFDIQYRMLSLIYNLSNSDNVTVSPFGSDEDTLSKSLSTEPSSEKPLQFWIDLLQSGEKPFRFPSQDDALSDWSDSTSHDPSDDLPLDKVSRQPKALFPQIENKRISIDFTSLVKEIQPRYWELSSLGTNRFPKSFLATHEKLCEQVGIRRNLNIVITEYQAIREILWMLRHPTKNGSLLFKAKSTENLSFFVNPNVSIPSLAVNSLTLALGAYTSVLDDIFMLQEFISQNDEGLPHTYEAYGEHLMFFLRRFSLCLISIEEQVAQQDTTYTLLDLENDTREWIKLIRFVARVHSKGICEGENWYKAIKLISVLNESLYQAFKDNEYEIAVEGLLRTLRPYFRIVNTWISEGRLEDWRNEFIYMSNPDLKGKDQHFWEDAFRMRDYETKLADDGLKPPSFLPFHKIHISGKSRHILILLDYIPKNANSFYLYGEFLEKLKSTVIPLEEKTPLVNVSNSLEKSREDLGIVDDPYLSLAFKEVEEMAVQDEKLEVLNEERSFLLEGCVLDPLKSFEPNILSSIDPIIDKYYNTSCERMLTFFKNELKLEKHLSAIRKVFLMEAGDLLEEFSTEIFKKVQERDSLFFDISNLTLHLRGCLSLRNSGLPLDPFSIVLSKNETGDILDQLRIIYHLDWPLSIVITSDHFEQYNKVFRFLLKVKRSLWALKVISPRNILSKDPWKIRKILLLRAWLFHFVGSVHSYFMTRVLHSTEVELSTHLEEAKDLDDIISIHTDYISQIVDRCFLRSNVSILRNAVLKVLSICTTLKDLVLTDETEDLSALINLEEVYSRSHQFLATTLKSIVQKRNLPHLESLAVALIHSCPENL